MRKFLYSRMGKLLVIVIMLAAAACSSLGISWAFTGLTAGMDRNILHPSAYEASAEMVNGYLQRELSDVIYIESIREKYYKDGKLDLNQTIDISDYAAGINKKRKTPELTYRLSDLADFYDTAGYVFLSYLVANRDDFIQYADQDDQDDHYISNEYDLAYDRADAVEEPMEEPMEASTGSAAEGTGSAAEATAATDVVYGAKAVSTGKQTLLYDEIVGSMVEDIDPDRDRNGDDRIIISCYPQLYNVLYNNGLPLEKKYIKNKAGTTIAEYAQKNLETVSILDCYTHLVQAARNAAMLVKETDQAESNAMIWLMNTSTKKVYSNVEGWESKQSIEGVEEAYRAHLLQAEGALSQNGSKQENLCFIAFNESEYDAHLVLPNQGGDSSLVTQMRNLRDIALSNISDNTLGAGPWLVFVGLDTSYAANDSASEKSTIYEDFRNKAPFGGYVIPGTLIAMAVTALMIGLALMQAGHCREDALSASQADGRRKRFPVHETAMDRFPIELLILIDFFLWIILIATYCEIINHASANMYQQDSLSFECFHQVLVWLRIIMVPLVCSFAILLCWQLKHYGRRIKLRSIGGSLFKSLFLAIRKVTLSTYRTRKEGQRLVIIYVILAAANAIIAGICGIIAEDVSSPIPVLIAILILVVGNILVLRKLMQFFSGRDAIRKGMDEIAAGNLTYKVDPEEASGYNREMAEGLNKVSTGLRNAVENEMKSERLKTDLITNVSHDIKTPLTSIINYVDILKRCEIKDEEIRSYVDILDRKSARLKQLVEDLVESSKISSGNISLDLRPIDMNQLILQMNAEFEEKFHKRNLSLVCSLPEDPMMIRADGSRLCRVIENLYNNAAKYAMPGSRVYVNGEADKGRVTITIRNVSEYPLNISANELTERFVRGDLARTSEGSGLGLEIARNLTVMQEGSFDIVLDGDLFKVILVFEQL